MRIRLDDTVEIVRGSDKGARGRVTQVLTERNKVVVEGVNRVFKHVRRSQQNPQGGRLEKEMPVSAANVMLVCSACGELARTGVRYLDDGSKERFCKKCSKGTWQIAPPKTAYAK